MRGKNKAPEIGWHLVHNYLIYCDPVTNIVKWAYELTPTGKVNSGRVWPYRLWDSAYLDGALFRKVQQGIYSGAIIMVERRNMPRMK